MDTTQKTTKRVFINDDLDQELKELLDNENKLKPPINIIDNANKSTDKEMKFIDLCCGIGGFHQALTKLNMKCVFACDIDVECRKIYEKNYKIKPEGNISKLDIPKIPQFDILCAGFPCQSFSKAGNQNGFDDERGNVFFEICKITKYHKPKYLILENVSNLASHDNGDTWTTIKKHITELNYYTYDTPLILNTLYFGIPQSRERVIILCKRKDLGELPKSPEINKKKLIKKTSLSSIIEDKVDEKYNIKGKIKITEQIWDNFLNLLKNNNISVPKFPIWTDWWDSDGNNTTVTKLNKNKTEKENQILIKKQQDAFYKKYKNWIDKNREFYKTNQKLLEPWLTTSRKKKEWSGAVRKMEWQTGENNLTMKDVLWSPRGSGIRIKKTDYSPTLVAMTSMIPIYGPLSREISPRECARLQSFPDNFIIHDDDKVSYKQFGNAVNVVMIEKCARFLIFKENLFS
jgi:DNA (cytosine-5)-methyltransferase 1